MFKRELEVREVEEGVKVIRGEEESVIFDILTSEERNAPLPISIREVERRRVEEGEYIDISIRLTCPSDEVTTINDVVKFVSIPKLNECKVNELLVTLNPCCDSLNCCDSKE